MITLKMANQERYDFCVIFTMSLCALESKQTSISLLYFKLGIQAPRSYLRLTCKYERHILPNTKVTSAKDHGKNYMKVRQPLVGHL